MGYFCIRNHEYTSKHFPLRHSSDTKSFRIIYDKIQKIYTKYKLLDVSLESYESLLKPILIKLLPIDFELWVI